MVMLFGLGLHQPFGHALMTFVSTPCMHAGHVVNVDTLVLAECFDVHSLCKFTGCEA